MEKKEKLNISCKCSEVTLDEFIDCLVNNNLKRLIKTDEATETELQQAWEKLYTEYSELSGNKQHKYYFTLYKSVYSMRLKMHIANLLLQGPELNLDDLYSLGYAGDVKSIIARLKFETIDLQTKEKELKKLTDKQTGTVKESDFDDWIISVGKYLGYQIKRKEMLLSEFLSANKAMIKDTEAKNRAAKSKKGKY
ncbi:MAG: hypothetical protein LBC68_12825 [Prevotellaceae bacterium]|jgi:hypothetical protein|nr:hypothetical protein [Prevotellaceae bacterium]